MIVVMMYLLYVNVECNLRFYIEKSLLWQLIRSLKSLIVFKHTIAFDITARNLLIELRRRGTWWRFIVFFLFSWSIVFVYCRAFSCYKTTTDAFYNENMGQIFNWLVSLKYLLENLPLLLNKTIVEKSNKLWKYI